MTLMSVRHLHHHAPLIVSQFLEGLQNGCREVDGHTLEPRVPCSMSVKSRGSHDLFPSGLFSYFLRGPRDRKEIGGASTKQMTKDTFAHDVPCGLLGDKRKEIITIFHLGQGSVCFRFALLGPPWRAIFFPVHQWRHNVDCTQDTCKGHMTFITLCPADKSYWSHMYSLGILDKQLTDTQGVFSMRLESHCLPSDLGSVAYLPMCVMWTMYLTPLCLHLSICAKGTKIS